MNEGKHPGALSLEPSKGRAQKVSIPDPFVVERGEGVRGSLGIASAASEIVLEGVGEVVSVAEPAEEQRRDKFSSEVKAGSGLKEAHLK